MNKPSIGYTLSSEEHNPDKLVQLAAQAEQVGFDFLSISDHIFPWVDQQGQSSFVWSVLGAISQATKKIPIMTGVTCPLIRTHPVIIAHAAATTASLLEDRFWLGLGTGENLNEHVVGQGWPNINQRQAMLSEAIDLIRQLWTGKLTDWQGDYFVADQAKIYTLPNKLPPIFVAAGGPQSSRLAGQMADGLISTSMDSELVKEFESSGGKGKPKYIQITVCYDTDVDKAKQTALEIWPNAGINGQASQELPMPAHFSQLAESVTADQLAQSIVCGADKEQHIARIQQCLDSGFDHIYVHHVGQDQQSFFNFYQKHILPHFK